MIPALILAAAVHVLAPYEWAGWPIHGEYNVGCWMLGKNMLECSVDDSKHPIFLFQENKLTGHFICNEPVTKQEFDQRIIKWRDQGFPHGICDEGKPIS